MPLVRVVVVVVIVVIVLVVVVVVVVVGSSSAMTMLSAVATPGGTAHNMRSRRAESLLLLPYRLGRELRFWNRMGMVLSSMARRRASCASRPRSSRVCETAISCILVAISLRRCKGTLSALRSLVLPYLVHLHACRGDMWATLASQRATFASKAQKARQKERNSPADGAGHAAKCHVAHERERVEAVPTGERPDTELRFSVDKAGALWQKVHRRLLNNIKINIP